MRGSERLRCRGGQAGHPLGAARYLHEGAATAPGQAADRLRRDHAGQRVPLVEDNAVNREVAEEPPRSVSLVVETAEDGKQAGGLALALAYALILMDMQMPGTDRLDATRENRRRAPTPSRSS